MLSSLVVSLDFFFRIKPRNLNVNDILDILDEDEDINVDKIFINPPEGEDSDGCDLSDEEEGGGDRDVSSANSRSMPWTWAGVRGEGTTCGGSSGPERPPGGPALACAA